MDKGLSKAKAALLTGVATAALVGVQNANQQKVYADTGDDNGTAATKGQAQNTKPTYDQSLIDTPPKTHQQYASNVAKAQGVVDKAEAQVHHAKVENDKANQAVADQQKVVDARKQAVNDAQVAIKENDAAIDAQKGVVADKREELANQPKAEAIAKAELDKARQKADQATKATDAAQADQAAKQKAAVTADQAAKDAKDTLAILNGQEVAAKNVVDREAANLSEATTAVDNLTFELNATNREIRAKESDLEQTKLLLQKKQGEIDNARADLDHIEPHHPQWTTHYRALINRLVYEQKVLMDFKLSQEKSLATLYREQRRLESELGRQKVKKASAEQAVAQAKDKLAGIQANVKAQQVRVVELAKQAATAKQALADANTALGVAQDNERAKRDLVKHAQIIYGNEHARTQQLKAELADAEATLQQLTAEKAKLADQLTNAQFKLTQAQGELTRLIKTAGHTKVQLGIALGNLRKAREYFEAVKNNEPKDAHHDVTINNNITNNTTNNNTNTDQSDNSIHIDNVGNKTDNSVNDNSTVDQSDNSVHTNVGDITTNSGNTNSGNTNSGNTATNSGNTTTNSGNTNSGNTNTNSGNTATNSGNKLDNVGNKTDNSTNNMNSGNTTTSNTVTAKPEAGDVQPNQDTLTPPTPGKPAAKDEGGKHVDLAVTGPKAQPKLLGGDAANAATTVSEPTELSLKEKQAAAADKASLPQTGEQADTAAVVAGAAVTTLVGMMGLLGARRKD